MGFQSKQHGVAATLLYSHTWLTRASTWQLVYTGAQLELLGMFACISAAETSAELSPGILSALSSQIGCWYQVCVLRHTFRKLNSKPLFGLHLNCSTDKRGSCATGEDDYAIEFYAPEYRHLNKHL